MTLYEIAYISKGAKKVRLYATNEQEARSNFYECIAPNCQPGYEPCICRIKDVTNFSK